jgi:TubC N-terminal docking domain
MIDDLLEALRAIGVEVFPRGETLGIRPASKVPPELKERLRAQKAEVLAVLKTARTTQTSKPISCRYDWIPGYRGLRLQCVAHQHDVGTATVFRMVSAGRDVLLEMRELGILTGQALHDAKRVN